MSIKWLSDFHKSRCADVVFRQKQILFNYFSLFPLNFHSKLMSYLPFTEKDFSKVKIVIVLCQHGIDFSPVKYLILDTKPFTMHVCLKLCHFQIWRIFSLFCKMHARISYLKCKGPKFSHLKTNLSTDLYKLLNNRFEEVKILVVCISNQRWLLKCILPRNTSEGILVFCSCIFTSFVSHHLYYCTYYELKKKSWKLKCTCTKTPFQRTLTS